MPPTTSCEARAATGSGRCDDTTVAADGSVVSSATNGLGCAPVTIVACRLGAGDRHVEEAAFLLDVVGQAVRVLLGVGQMHDDVRPLLALDPVDGGEQHAAGRPLDGELIAHPPFERGRIVVQRREVA